ncbi:heat stress transcription factor A-3 [Morus notabilis]|uniref:heat stress transcription factor A-3 n=1 Tax=Morus notabilis TaxID=981085 RepID=UPI000CED70CE|nr:heat stress transcription factor A-3 [Morus notabilis]
MEEVVELQQQQRGTVHLVESVNKRLQSVEQKQKQMVSFFTKMVQNPSFIAKLKQKVEQKEIGSSRARRKFVTHQQHEASEPDSSMEGRLVKYSPGLRNLTIPSGCPDLNPFLTEQDDITAMQVFGKNLAGEGASSMLTEDPLFKGKGILSLQQEVGPEYYVSFPKDFMEKSFPELFSTGMETTSKQEDIWNMGLDAAGGGMSSGGNEMLDSPATYEALELGMMSGMFDLWDLGSLQVEGGSGINKWPADEALFDQPASQAGQPKDII